MGNLLEPQDVVGEWAAKLSARELQEMIEFYTEIAYAYDRGEQSVNTYKANRLQQELDRRSETNEAHGQL